MQKKIYIAGKVTGELALDIRVKFLAKQTQLEWAGYSVVNPVTLCDDETMEWKKAMRICINALLGCDEICLLPDWHLSQGARPELTIAAQLGMNIIYP